jgi:hypothetical protein
MSSSQFITINNDEIINISNIVSIKKVMYYGTPRIRIFISDGTKLHDIFIECNDDEKEQNEQFERLQTLLNAQKL